LKEKKREKEEGNRQLAANAYWAATFSSPGRERKKKKKKRREGENIGLSTIALSAWRGHSRLLPNVEKFSGKGEKGKRKEGKKKGKEKKGERGGERSDPGFASNFRQNEEGGCMSTDRHLDAAIWWKKEKKKKTGKRRRGRNTKQGSSAKSPLEGHSPEPLNAIKIPEEKERKKKEGGKRKKKEGREPQIAQLSAGCHQ